MGIKTKPKGKYADGNVLFEEQIVLKKSFSKTI